MEENQKYLSNTLADAFSKFHQVMKHRSTFVEGLRPRQVQVLLYLKRHQGEKGLRISTIADHMSISAPSATMLVRELEEKKQVARFSDPSDKRSVRIRLTPEGTDSVRKGKNHMDQQFQGLTEHLGKENSVQLVSLLTQAIDYFSNKEYHTLGGYQP